MRRHGLSAFIVALFALLVAVQAAEARNWRGLGVCAMRTQQFDLASYSFTTVLEQHPSDVLSLVYRGEARIQLGKTQLGRDDLNAAIAAAATSQDPAVAELARRAENTLHAMTLA